MSRTDIESGSDSSWRDPIELLIKEAERVARQRRIRHGVIGAVALVGLAVAFSIVATTSNTSSKGGVSNTEPGRSLVSLRSSFVDLAGANHLTSSGTNLWVTLDYTSPDLKTSRYSVVEIQSTKDIVHVLNSPTLGFDWPEYAAQSGATIWITNDQSSTISVVDVHSGALVHDISSSGGDLHDPSAIAISKGRAWVISSEPSGQWLSELNVKTRSLIRVIKGRNSDLKGVNSLQIIDGRIWAVDTQGAAITELNATDGSLIRIFSVEGSTSTKWASATPVAVAVRGNRVWVVVDQSSVNQLTTESWLDEYDLRTGTLLRVISSSRDDLNFPIAIIAEGAHLWVLNGGSTVGSSSVAEFNAASGILVGLLSGGHIGLSSPLGFADMQGNLWILNGDNGMNGSLLEINGTSGKVEKRLQ